MLNKNDLSIIDFRAHISESSNLYTFSNIEGSSSSATYNTNKRVFIDMERGLIGFNIMREQYEGEKPDRYDADGMPEFNESRYVLLKYDDGKLKLIADVPISDNDWDVRAIYRDGYLYAFSETKVVALHVDAE